MHIKAYGCSEKEIIITINYQLSTLVFLKIFLVSISSLNILKTCVFKKMIVFLLVIKISSKIN